MNRLGIVFLAVTLVAVGSALGQDEGPNSFGLYFDDPGDGCYMDNYLEGVIGSQYAAHMVIANPDEWVLGLEIEFRVSPSWAGDILGTTFSVVGDDADDTPNGIRVGFSAPVPPNSCSHVYLGDLFFLLVGTDGLEILAGPNTPSIFVNRPAYLGFPSEQPIPLYFSTAADWLSTDHNGWLWPGYGLCAVNREAAIPVENATWSNVKALYR